MDKSYSLKSSLSLIIAATGVQHLVNRLLSAPLATHNSRPSPKATQLFLACVTVLCPVLLDESASTFPDTPRHHYRCSSLGSSRAG